MHKTPCSRYLFPRLKFLKPLTRTKDRVIFVSLVLAVLLHLLILGVIPFPAATPPLPVLDVQLAPEVMKPFPKRSPTPKPPQLKRSEPIVRPAVPNEVPSLAAAVGLADQTSTTTAPAVISGVAPGKAEDPAPVVPPSPLPIIERPKTIGEVRFAALPPQGEIDYQVSLGSLDVSVARGTLRWKITGQRYHLDLEARTVGIARLLKSNPVTQISEGRIGPQGLIPDQYRVLGRISETDEAMAQFDWTAQTLTLQPSNTVFPMPEGTQDLLSFFFQFSIVPPETESVTRSITNGRKLDRYSYELTEKIRLKLPLGEVDALHVSRLTGLNEDSFDIWLGEKYHLLPVQIRFFARGRTITLYAKDIRIAAPGPDSN